MGRWDLGSGTDFDDLALEDFQGLLNKRVVLEIIFIEGHGSEFFFHRWGGRNSGPGRASGSWRGCMLRLRPRRLRGSLRLGSTPARGRLGFDELNLGVRMAEFVQLGLQ